MLTYRSTGTNEVIIVEKDADGTRRVARAVQDQTNPRQWRAQLEHPSGIRPCSPVYGNRADAALALSHFLNETQSEWRQEISRGHRTERRMAPDRNVRVDDLGQDYAGSAPARRYV